MTIIYKNDKDIFRILYSKITRVISVDLYLILNLILKNKAFNMKRIRHLFTLKRLDSCGFILLKLWNNANTEKIF